MNKLITIIGPTASGKSKIAINLAKDFEGEIISADSKQIYRYMNIGSGKEPGKIRRLDRREKITRDSYISNDIPHYMIDILHPNTEYNVSKFVNKTQKIRNDIWKRNKNPIIAGGTMFWAQALVENNTFTQVPPNYNLRKKLETKNVNELFGIIEKKDLRRAIEIKNKNEINNKVRLIRALEIINVLGYVPEQKKMKINPKTNLIIAISLDKKVLYNKIEKRMDNWFNDGIFNEIIELHKKFNVSWSRLESFGLEYKWCTKYIRNQISYEEMRKNTISDLKKYAKRQLTWIKRWENQYNNINYIKNYDEVRGLAKNFYSNS